MFRKKAKYCLLLPSYRSKMAKIWYSKFMMYAFSMSSYYQQDEAYIGMDQVPTTDYTYYYSKLQM